MILKGLIVSSLFILFANAEESSKLPKIRRLNHIPVKKALVGDNVKLSCVLPKSGDKRRLHEYTWSKDGRVLTKGAHYKIRRFTFLKIRSVKLSDSGKYKCVIKNSHGSDSLTTEVRVYSRSSQNVKCDLRFVDQRGSQVRVDIVGNYMDLDCAVHSCKDVSVTWFFNGKMLTSAKISKARRKKLSRNGQFLELWNLLPRDNGKYTCYVSNGDATISRTYSVKAIQVLRASPFLVSPKGNSTIYVKLGQNKTVECVAYAQRNMHFQLLRIIKNDSANGTDRLEVFQKPTQFSADFAFHADKGRRNRAVVQFNNITKKDLGLYTCMAGNSFGFSSVSFYLRQDPS